MTRPLSIAVVCLPGLGGSGVVAAELALGLAARGHRIHVVATELPERLRGHLVPDRRDRRSSSGEADRREAGIEGASLPESLRAGESAETGVTFVRVDVPTSPVFEHGPYDVAVASQLVELIRATPIDLVHLHYAVPHAASALLVSRMLGDRAPAMVITLHGTDVTRLGVHPSLHAVTAFAVAACDGITTPSRYLRGAAAERFAIAPERIEVIPNFVDLERFAPPAVRDRAAGGLAALFAGAGPGAPTGDADDTGPILFHVSNFRPIKRPLDLVEVLARVRRSLPARAVLVGDGPERDAVVRRADELGVADQLCLLGRRDDFAALLGHADGFVLPSESEGFGVAALEAMAAGVPVFGYDVGGLPEVVAGGAGTLVACCDVDALAAAVVAGIRDPRQRDAMGRAARARAEDRFGGGAAIARYEAYFRQVLARRPPRKESRGSSV
ncbi:MAG TPA: N-acetyl-alpha-D-glucosaminyl L-malate synthase BshA [Kofleriaceae bacterium]|nr:N-acetyl-alpha-D-glucosaminyl L-malate synthase BshA [Kofleriaceae bacterium]